MTNVDQRKCSKTFCEQTRLGLPSLHLGSFRGFNGHFRRFN